MNCVQNFNCNYFNLTYLTSLHLFVEIAGLPSSIQRLLFDELLDKDVQKGTCFKPLYYFMRRVTLVIDM